MSNTQPDSYFSDWSDEQLLQLFEMRVKIKQNELGFLNNNAGLEKCRNEILCRMAFAGADDHILIRLIALSQAVILYQTWKIK